MQHAGAQHLRLESSVEPPQPLFYTGATSPPLRISAHLWPSTCTIPVSDEVLPRSMAEPAIEPSSVVLPQPAGVFGWEGG